MYDVGGKLLNGIKSMSGNSVACVRVKGGESECFRMESDVMKEVKIGDGVDVREISGRREGVETA